MSETHRYAILRTRHLPDDTGKRADCEYAIRILESNNMLEWFEGSDPPERRKR